MGGSPRTALAFRLVLLAGLLAPPASAGERAITLDPAASRITFTLDTTFHEVHGTMALSDGMIRFDPGAGTASGAITVDARRTETGNEKRDRTMHAEVLESERFPTIRFRVERVEGTLAVPGRSELRLVGVMTLHGADHPMTLPAVVESQGDRVRGEMRFPIPYVAWGLHDPSFFVVRAEKTVDVTVLAEGRWTEPAPAAR